MSAPTDLADKVGRNAATGDDILDVMAGLKARGRAFVLATVVRTEDATSAKAGAKAVITGDGAVHGWIGGGCTQGAVRRAAVQSLEDGRPRLISVKPAATLAQEGLQPGALAGGVEVHRSVCPSGGTVDVFIEPSLPRPSLIVCGGSPVARALAELAPNLGFGVTVAALPEDHAGFPSAARRISGFNLSDTGDATDRYILVATQGKRDREALRHALGAGARLVGFIGSRKKAETLSAQMAEDGMAEDVVAGLRCPAGLDIGAITPEEIALSVLAEIVRERRRAIRDTGTAATQVDLADGGTVETRIVGAQNP